MSKLRITGITFLIVSLIEICLKIYGGPLLYTTIVATLLCEADTIIKNIGK